METERTFLYCLYGLIFICASNCMFPVYGQQPRPGMLKPEEELPTSRSTSFLSNDWVYWESPKPVEYYVINQTPLKTLPGYDTLYPQSVSSTLPTEKGYAVTWEIVDSQLYLCNIDFYTLRGWGSSGSLEIENEELKAAYEKMEDEYYPDGKKYRIMEQFTGKKFQKKSGEYGMAPEATRCHPCSLGQWYFSLKTKYRQEDDSCQFRIGSIQSGHSGGVLPGLRKCTDLQGDLFQGPYCLCGSSVIHNKRH